MIIPWSTKLSIWSMLCILKQLPLRDVSQKMRHRAMETTESYWHATSLETIPKYKSIKITQSRNVPCACDQIVHFISLQVLQRDVCLLIFHGDWWWCIFLWQKKMILQKNDPPGKMWWCYFEVVLHCIPNRCNKIHFKQAICLFKVKINVFHKVVWEVSRTHNALHLNLKKNWNQQCKAPSHLIFRYVICRCFIEKYITKSTFVLFINSLGIEYMTLALLAPCST